MRAAGAFRTGAAPGGALAPRWSKDRLWRAARATPSLDLNFADSKSLTDGVTGQNLVTFTRSSSATYVDSTGTLRSAVTNLLLRSEALATNPWFSANITLTNSSTDVQDPIGGFNSTKIVATGSSSAIGQGAIISTASTGSIWLRTASGTASFSLIIYLSNSPFTIIGIANITVTTTWQRFSVTSSVPPSSASYNFQLQSIPATTLYAWGAQLEQSSTVGEYIPTTSTINSAPRFDHNPLTGESLGLLVEESRTNFWTYSDDFANAAWTKVRSSITSNTIVAPDGTLTGDKLIASTDASTTHFVRQDVSVTSGTAYTQTIYAKAGEYTQIYMAFYTDNSAFTAGAIIFTLTGDGIAGIPDGTLTSNSITPVGNGWYRCQITATATATATGVFRIQSATGNTNGFTGDGTSGIYIWGAQLEAGAFPTSYIPTTTAAATRSADVASITGSNFSSWYRQDEGTVFANARTNATHGGTNSFPRIFTLRDGTTNNTIDSYYRVLSAYTDTGYRVDVAGVNQASFDTNDQRNGQRQSIGYAANNFAFVVGGAIANTDTSGSLPVVTQLRLGARGDGSSIANGTIRRLVYWGQRLPNTVLQAITQ